MNDILYKYRKYSANSLSSLINQQLHFSAPARFNDPIDCQISITQALKTAIESANKKTHGAVKSRLEKLMKIEDVFKKMETDINSSGIFSLCKYSDKVQMWSHYADEHKGFCIGYSLSEKFRKSYKTNAIIGLCDVHYAKDNPYLDYFIEFGESSERIMWDEFWVPLLSLGLVAKSLVWSNEDEVRIVRGKPGLVRYSKKELSEIIFGLKMKEPQRDTIRKILSGSEWSHVAYKEVVRKNDGFQLEIIGCTI